MVGPCLHHNIQPCPAMPETPEEREPEDPSAIFPWEHVEACRKKRRRRSRALDEALERYGGEARPCPQCGMAGRDLRWIHFSSPPWTWQIDCGREGWLTVCEPCRWQVDFFQEIMN